MIFEYVDFDNYELGILLFEYFDLVILVYVDFDHEKLDCEKLDLEIWNVFDFDFGYFDLGNFSIEYSGFDDLNLEILS